MEHVVPHLPKPYGDWNNHMPKSWLFNYNDRDVKPRHRIALEVRDFLIGDLPDGTGVELWADYCAYDHVALAQLWGAMPALPREIPRFTKDLRQLWDDRGRPPLPTMSGRHDALVDAKHNLARWHAMKV
jgi:hypothetical protein